VSRRHAIEAHVGTLLDLRDVLDAMRTLSLAEIAKLHRTEAMRRDLLAALDGVAEATAPFYPALGAPPASALWILVGSERGFCAGFNEAVARRWDAVRAEDPRARAIAVGSASAVAPSDSVLARVAGPAITEDIDATLIAVLREVAAYERSGDVPIALSTIATGAGGVETTAILPYRPPRATAAVRPPDLNVTPQEFIRGFVDQFVDAALHRIFAGSLLSENRARLAHMTSAIDRLDDTVTALRRRMHRMRQEEITQEVEMILLSADDRSRASMLSAGAISASSMPTG